MSGHIFFLRPVVRVRRRHLCICTGFWRSSPGQRRPQAIFDDLPRVENTPEIRIECPDRIKFEAVERFKAYARSRYDECVDIDGVRFTRATPGGW
ncbi:MAG: hypothetical protein MZU91_02785 [Desulfosudis oleivorans]|nr:hypothetical protein [Desulfosudis oleivorans]